MKHIDLVANDWAGAREVLIAQVSLTPGGAVLVSSANPTWERRLSEPVTDRWGTTTHPHEGLAFLEAISRKYDGSYHAATDVHESSECRFRVGTDLPMTVTAPLRQPKETP